MPDRDTRYGNPNELPDPSKRVFGFRKEPGKVYLLRRTSTEEVAFDPDEVRDAWAERHDQFESFEDWVIRTFELHDGSQFSDRYFHDTTNYDSGIELIVRGEDE